MHNESLSRSIAHHPDSSSGKWLRPEVGDELLHAPLAHAVSRSDGGRAYACDEERAHAVSASTPTPLEEAFGHRDVPSSEYMYSMHYLG